MPIYIGFFPTLLHAAIFRTELPVFRLLTKDGAVCNTPYSDSQTQLFHAVTKGSLNVVRTLVEERGASVDIRDIHGNTDIDSAKRNLQYARNKDFQDDDYMK